MSYEQYVIRKTKPKKGQPAWVCFNYLEDKYKQTFGNTPEEALKAYGTNKTKTKAH